jgi:hypothetical protein
MARKTRIEFEGALYHVIVRGNQKRKVFRSDDDFRFYLDILHRYKSRYQFALYAYVLMTNHIHLFIETGTIPLNKIGPLGPLGSGLGILVFAFRFLYRLADGSIVDSKKVGNLFQGIRDLEISIIPF